RFLGAPGFAPTHPVAHRGVRRWHRLAVQPNDLAQPACATSVALRKRDPLGADSARTTRDATQGIDQGDSVLRPRQIVPGPLLDVSHAPCGSSTPRTFVAPDPAAVDPDPHPRPRAVRFPLKPFDAKPVETQNPSTLARRSHVSSLLCGNTERTPSGLPMASGIAVSLFIERPGRRADRPPNSGPRRRPGLTQIAAFKSPKSPFSARGRAPPHGS